MVCLALTAGLVVGAWLSVNDVRTKRIPNAVVFPTLAGVLLMLSAHWLITGAYAPLLFGATAGTACFALFWVLAVLGKGAIGGGDVKLSALLGMLMGSTVSLSTVVVGTLSMFVVGGLVSAIFLLLKKGKLRDTIPFAPAMYAGTLIGLLSGLEWSWQ